MGLLGERQFMQALPMIACMGFYLFFVGCFSPPPKKFSSQGSLSAHSQSPHPQNQGLQNPNLPSPENLQKFQRGLKYLDEEKYESAVRVFESLLVESPSSQVEILAFYNAGSAHEGLRQCQKAVQYFKKAAHASAKNKIFKIKAQALLRLSYAYECLGRDDKVIATLMVFLRKEAKDLSDEVIWTEIPARMGGSYMRLGNFQLGDRFFKEAEQGLSLLRDEKKDVYRQRELLAKALFFMGRVNMARISRGGAPISQETSHQMTGVSPKGSRLSVVKTKRYLTALRHQQVYLLKAVELESKKWSKIAMAQLIDTYDHLWSLINQPDPSASLQDLGGKKKRKIQEKHWTYQLSLAQMVLNNILALKKQKFQVTKKSKEISSLFIILRQHERNLTRYLAKHQHRVSSATFEPLKSFKNPTKKQKQKISR